MSHFTKYLRNGFSSTEIYFTIKAEVEVKMVEHCQTSSSYKFRPEKIIRWWKIRLILMETRWPYTYYPAGARKFANNMESSKIRPCSGHAFIIFFLAEKLKSFRFRTWSRKARRTRRRRGLEATSNSRAPSRRLCIPGHAQTTRVRDIYTQRRAQSPGCQHRFPVLDYIYKIFLFILE